MTFFLNSYAVPGGMPAMTEEMQLRAEKDLFYFQVRYLPFSEDLLIKCLEYEGIKYQEVVLLQSRLETGYYTSDIFLNGNNLFGMKYPTQRPTVATGTYRDHAKYEHWSDSVIDYALWQQYYISRGYRIGEGEDTDFYLVFLKVIPYAEDKRYVSKLVLLSDGDFT
ncbi:MAG: glucosaminidase domain-containing protein [Bacteroidota bacterium]|nr:glucosaminidase domain-containing protein [Bacteroidota bacterium]